MLALSLGVLLTGSRTKVGRSGYLSICEISVHLCQVLAVPMSELAAVASCLRAMRYDAGLHRCANPQAAVGRHTVQLLQLVCHYDY